MAEQLEITKFWRGANAALKFLGVKPAGDTMRRENLGREPVIAPADKTARFTQALRIISTRDVGALDAGPFIVTRKTTMYHVEPTCTHLARAAYPQRVLLAVVHIAPSFEHAGKHE